MAVIVRVTATNSIISPVHDRFPETPKSLRTRCSMALPSILVELPNRFTRCRALYPVLWLAPDLPLCNRDG
jgi:hypothetical protein